MSMNLRQATKGNATAMAKYRMFLDFSSTSEEVAKELQDQIARLIEGNGAIEGSSISSVQEQRGRISPPRELKPNQPLSFDDIFEPDDDVM